MTSPATGAPHAVLLAAGASRRFGTPKLLAVLEGRPVIAHVRDVLEAALATGALAGIHAVVRADDSALADALPAAWSVPISDARSGLSTSLRAGIRHVQAAGAPAVLLCLADQPRLRLGVIASLIAAWQAGATVVRPVYEDEPDVPGHPLLLDRSRFTLVDDATGDRGLEPVLMRRAIHVVSVPVPGRHPDLDTPDDLARL